MSKTEPLGGKILTRPFLFLSLLALIAAVLLLIRFVYGLGYVTNLNNGYPWGLWVALDIHVTAAIGCGGYVLAVIVYIMNKGEFHPLMRPALLGSAFAYTLASLAAFIDIGRWWNFYQIALPWNINLNSVMFEIAICMALYTLILWIELVPPVLEKFNLQKHMPAFKKSLYIIIPLGIVLPTMHQSGLGGLVVAAGDKIWPFWSTPWISLLFLVSAIIIGFSIVIFEGSMTAMGLKRPLELKEFQRLSGMLVWVLAFFLIVRFADLLYRNAFETGFTDMARATAFLIETGLFLLPLVILIVPSFRASARLLFLAAVSCVLAGAMLRFNSLIIGYEPSAGYVYFPSLMEIMISIGMLAVEVVAFVYIVKRFPILPKHALSKKSSAAASPPEVPSGTPA